MQNLSCCATYICTNRCNVLQQINHAKKSPTHSTFVYIRTTIQGSERVLNLRLRLTDNLSKRDLLIFKIICLYIISRDWQWSFGKLMPALAASKCITSLWRETQPRLLQITKSRVINWAVTSKKTSPHVLTKPYLLRTRVETTFDNFPL